MNTITKPQLTIITQEHIDTIADYYPSVDIRHISNLSVKNGILSFRYEDRPYTCVMKRKKESTSPVTPDDILQTQGEFLKSVFQVLNAGHEHAQNVNYAMYEGVRNIIKEYFSGMDYEKIQDLHFSGGHILFRYATAIYMCPVKHMYEFKNGQSLKGEVVKISDIIKEHYPDIGLGFIHDIFVDQGMIGFEYLAEKYFCPLKSPEMLILECEKARVLEEELLINESQRTKPLLKIVK